MSKSMPLVMVNITNPENNGKMLTARQRQPRQKLLNLGPQIAHVVKYSEPCMAGNVPPSSARRVWDAV
jgi:hypothetical protein